MNQKIKLGLYGGFFVGALIFGVLFYSSYKRVNGVHDSTNYPPASLSAAVTNIEAQTTNSVSGTNATTPEDPLVTTNSPVGTTNSAATNGVATNAAELPVPVRPEVEVATAREPVTGRSEMVGYFFGFLLMAVLLGLLIARDIAEFFGNRSVEFLLNDEGTGIKNPEYDDAEREWANGNHLDAIRLMRDYLTRHPREQYVALRIAEIYEKDLKNYLAAALEYEEVLKHKLPPDRWGWAAIHLCNLYSKLNKTNQAVELLRRIATEFSETPAAEKARKRLAMFETVGEEALDGDLPESIQSLPPKPGKPEREEPASNLPPGFRPKN
jgi:TolA-binding protein